MLCWITVTETSTLCSTLEELMSVSLGKPRSATSAAMSIDGAARETLDEALRTRVTVKAAVVAAWSLRARKEPLGEETSHATSRAQTVFLSATRICSTLTPAGIEDRTCETCVMSTVTLAPPMVPLVVAVATAFARDATFKLEATVGVMAMADVVTNVAGGAGGGGNGGAGEGIDGSGGGGAMGGRDGGGK